MKWKSSSVKKKDISELTNRTTEFTQKEVQRERRERLFFKGG